jgi:nicotinamide phosphoribosyltransferase
MKLYAATVTDGYKVGHGPLYADDTTQVYSNLTPRSDKIYLRNCTKFYDGMLVFVGAQGAVQEIQEMWQDSFFGVPKEKAIGKFARRMSVYLGGKVKAEDQLAELHDLGFLPLHIKALEEGTKVKMGVPVLTITNTLPPFFWLVNYLETVLSDLTWKTATNATIAAEYKAICKHYAEITDTDDFTVSIQCHDFSMRGMSGPEDAARAGFAHLTSFIGTDTLPAMDYAEDYYNADPDGLIAISVVATEHAVATNNILSIEQGLNHDHNTRLDAELIFMKDLITRKHPTGIVSYVADSFDFWSVLTDILPALKNTILSRGSQGLTPGKLVIRPDSGDPVKVVCGDEEAEVGSPEYKGAIEVLWETFGGTITDKGYKMLDSHIGLIYGDSITTKRAEEILRRLVDKGFASGNVVFGVGSYTYQCNTRDTFGFAVKATYSVVNGIPVNIFKDPKTDSGKKSAKGLLFVGYNTDGGISLYDNVSEEEEADEQNRLKTIFKDGQFMKRTTLDQIRQRLS